MFSKIGLIRDVKFQANMVLINPASEADEESMWERMESRRAREKAEKKAKKEGGGKKRGGEADFKVPVWCSML